MVERINSWLSKIPALLSSNTSIFIYLFLFSYLVVFPIICSVIPFFKHYMPSDMQQLILGNYTNVLSALGASIAAGSGVAVNHKMKESHQKHYHLVNAINELNQKLDQLIALQNNKMNGKSEKPE